MVSPYFFPGKKTDDLFSHRPLESDGRFSCRLLTTPIFPRRLSSVYPVPPSWMVSPRAVPPSPPVTPLVETRMRIGLILINIPLLLIE